MFSPTFHAHYARFCDEKMEMMHIRDKMPEHASAWTKTYIVQLEDSFNSIDLAMSRSGGYLHVRANGPTV